MFSSSSDVEVTVSPVAVVPRQTVTARVTTTAPVRKVTAARLEWGYLNHFRYHWAGDANSAEAGDDRDTDEWVCVARVDLPIATGEFAETSAAFTVPSWAPASSQEIATWACRLVVERGGRDVDIHEEFTVRVGRDDVFDFPGLDEPVEVLSGAAETVIDIVLPTTIFVSGEPIRGQTVLTPTRDLPDGDLAMTWQRRRASHPLTRTPSEGGSLDGPIVPLGKKIPLRAGVPITVPFEIPLPADAPPTAAAVHSSMDWYVQARMFYAGETAHMTERVVKPIVVVNAL